uniref:Uncharacterized protein n=1 Tax=Anopheles maculatus TaxID=74869 RepID=A0A182SNR1_9DIPT
MVVVSCEEGTVPACFRTLWDSVWDHPSVTLEAVSCAWPCRRTTLYYWDCVGFVSSSVSSGGAGKGSRVYRLGRRPGTSSLREGNNNEHLKKTTTYKRQPYGRIMQVCKVVVSGFVSF